MSDMGNIPNLLKIGKDAYIVIPPSPESTSALGVSSLGASDKGVEKTPLSAPTPRLAEPKFVAQDGHRFAINLDAFKYSLEHRYHEIIMSLLDKWLESIVEDEEKLKEQMMSRAYLNWLDDMHIDFFETEQIARSSAAEFKRYMLDTSLYTHWLDTLPPDQKISELSKGKRYQIMAGLENAVSEYRDNLQTNGRSSRGAICNCEPGYRLHLPWRLRAREWGWPQSHSLGAGEDGQGFEGVPSSRILRIATGCRCCLSDELSARFAGRENPGKRDGSSVCKGVWPQFGPLAHCSRFHSFLNAACNMKHPNEEELGELVSSVKLILLITALGLIYRV